MKIYLIGHISPDLDAIASTITYAEFLKKSKRYEGSEIIPIRGDDINKETSYILNKLELDTPNHIKDIKIDSSDAFILVDHNEEAQRHADIPNEQIIEIIDHHKLNINFTSPIRLDIKPFGCTATLVYEHFEMYGIKPSENAKILMLACILSDTQGLKSSTTTGYDSEVANILADQTNTDIEDFTFKLFKAKSDTTGLSAKELCTRDYKIFDFGSKKVLINQIETVEQDKILQNKKELIDAMVELKSEHGLNQIYNMVTDILKVNTHLLYTNAEEKNVIERAFTTTANDNVADIGPKMSRKKDVAPAIEKVLIN